MGISLGEMLRILADRIGFVAGILVKITVGVVILLLLLRWITDLVNANPFGRLIYYLRKPTNELVYYIRSSQFYFPLKQALKFDPTVLMALIAVAIVWYVALSVIGYLTTVLSGLGMSLDFMAAGAVARGVYTLVGVSLLAVIFFLMTLMTIVFINWISGKFNRVAYWSLHRLNPLLRVFEFGGALAGFSFVILWIVLSLAANAVGAVFFRS